jgi:hypothetical protein
MPRYTVILTRTLILTTQTAVSAPDADVAYDTVKDRLEQGAFGTLMWDVEQCQAELDAWQEESDDIYITTVEEAP